MAMNALVSRLYDNETTYTRTCEVEVSSQDISCLRQKELKPIDVQALRKKYAHMPNLGKRIAPRYAIKLAVIVVGSTQSFRTETVNVSMSGVLLKDQLPEKLMQGNLEIVILAQCGQTRTTRRILLRASPVGALRSERLAFTKTSDEANSILSQILEDLTPMAYAA